MRLLPTAALLALLLAAGCADSADQAGTLGAEPTFRKDGTLTFVGPDGAAIRTIDVEIAETPETRAQGLMGRRQMGYDKGMLFLFPEADDSGFWMRNTPMPLDIVFVGPDSQVVSIAERTTPFSDENIYPAAPKQFVVEVRAGFADRFGLTDSTRIRWQRSPSATASGE